MREQRKRGKNATWVGTRTGDLLSDLVDQPSDEKTGVNASLGFTYQQWWAALKAAELYADGADFAIGMEIKEDVAVLDSPHKPSSVHFFQIKKYEQSGVWAWSQLLRASPKSKTPLPSVLAKLYSRRHALSGHKTKLSFISNVGFRVPLAAGTTLQFSIACDLDEFGSKHLADVKAKVAEQLSLAANLVDLSDFRLERTHLPLAEQETFVAGKLSTLNEEGNLPFKISRPSLSARMLASEIQQKSSNNDYANTVDKLLKRCLSREDIGKVFIKVEGTTPSAQSQLDEALHTLDGERFSWGRREQIRHAKVRLCASVSDRTNAQVQQLLAAFISCARKSGESVVRADTLGQAMVELVDQAHKDFSALTSGVDAGYLDGIALLVLKDVSNEYLLSPATGSKSEDAQ